MTGVVDDKVGLAKVLELLGAGSDQHVVLQDDAGISTMSGGIGRGGARWTHHEQGVVGSRGDDSDLDPVLGVPSGESVKDVDVLSGVQVVDGSFTVDLESVLAENADK